MDFVILVGRLLLAGVFAVAGLAKLLDLPGSQQAMRGFGLPEVIAKPAGLALPLLELAIAILLIPIATAAWGGVAALALLVLFILGISYNLSRGRKPDCHCFGQLHSEPIGPPTLIRNGVLGVVAALVAVAGLSQRPGVSLGDWLSGLSALGWVVLIGGLLIIGTLAGIIWLLVHLLGQNGRLLVRLDKIEASLEERGMLPEEEEEEDEEEEGLPIGSPAPAFTLTGLHGETMTLDALKAAGKSTLLVFSDPNCGPCNALLPDLGRWQREHAAKLTVALISRGTAEANKAKASEHGLTHVLLQKDDEVADAYQTNGTPTAVIVKADGTIGSLAAPGAEAIRKLVAQAVEGKLPTAAPRRPPRPAPVAPPAPRPAPPTAGLDKIGKPAPALALQDLGGQTVNLSDFMGQPTAVLFWNPGCGFCARMLPDLKAWEENPPVGAPKLLVVSTGDPEQNKAMGLKSSVVLDSGFSTGRTFGASGTPSAVLVGPDGNVATGVAVGAPSVLGLLRGEAPAIVPSNGGAPMPEPPAVKIGDPAPAVKLNDLDGKQVDLAEHRGTRTLVLFWNPGCGFCKRMLPDLKKWEEKPPKGAPKLVLVSSGSAEENKAQELRSLILLDQNFSVGSAFGADGTPSGILIDAQGKIASELAVGSPDVMALAKTTK